MNIYVATKQGFWWSFTIHTIHAIIIPNTLFTNENAEKRKNTILNLSYLTPQRVLLKKTNKIICAVNF